MSDRPTHAAVDSKTLLLAGMPPGDGNVGEILINDMLACDGIEPVSFAGLITQEHFDRRIATRLTTQRCFAPPAEFARRDAPGLKGTVTTIVDRHRRYEPAIKKISHQVVEFVRQESPDQIWANLNSTATIDVAYEISESVNIPILAHIWDDPRHIMMQRQLDRYTVSRTMKRFERVLQRSARLGVICESMSAAYGAITSAPSVIVRHGLQDHVEARSEPTSDDEFRIGISGSMYCYSAWKALQLALDEMNWRVGDKRIVLVVAGSDIRFRAYRPAECRFYGWRSLEYVKMMLSDCDVLYLPHPFGPLQEPLARLSFPTKLSTYVGTGRPLLFHAPTYSSLSEFSNKHDLGVLTHELDVTRLSQRLREFFSDRTEQEKQSLATARIGSTVLSRSQFESSTRDFLAPALNRPSDTAAVHAACASES